MTASKLPTTVVQLPPPAPSKMKKYALKLGAAVAMVALVVTGVVLCLYFYSPHHVQKLRLELDDGLADDMTYYDESVLVESVTTPTGIKYTFVTDVKQGLLVGWLPDSLGEYYCIVIPSDGQVDLEAMKNITSSKDTEVIYLHVQQATIADISFLNAHAYELCTSGHSHWAYPVDPCAKTQKTSRSKRHNTCAPVQKGVCEYVVHYKCNSQGECKKFEQRHLVQ